MKGRPVLISVLALGLLLALAAGFGVAQGPGPQGDSSTMAVPVGTGFTYQGRLTDGGANADGSYDLEFELYDHPSAGSQVGSTVTKGDVTVTDGLFTVELDFGNGVFTGEARWLEIGVRPGDSTGAYTTLAPRQALTAAPYAVYALGAAWSGLTDVPPDFADGVDNDTTYMAGTGLDLVGTTFSADTTTLQRRVSGTCDAGNAIRVVQEDGSVTCEPVGDGVDPHDHWGETWSGSGAGLTLSSSDEDALRLHGGDDGLQIESAADDGIFVTSAGQDGVLVESAGRDAFSAVDAGGDGLYVKEALDDGVDVRTAGDNGVYVESAGGNGVHVSAAYSGVRVESAGTKGVYVLSADGHGVYVSHAGASGFKVGTADGDGVYVGSAANDGVHVESAGNDGVYGQSTAPDGRGVVGVAPGTGMYAEATATGGTGIYAKAGPAGYAGHFDGNVEHDGGIMVHGWLTVEGPARGFFPRPAYDSGWVAVGRGDSKWLYHNLGGDPDSYVVDMQFNCSIGNGINIYQYGMDGGDGAYWERLDESRIMIYRGDDDLLAEQIRIRIWVYN